MRSNHSEKTVSESQLCDFHLLVVLPANAVCARVISCVTCI